MNERPRKEQAQIIFDPLEEQFDLPALLIEFGDGQSWQFKLIGPKYYTDAVFVIVVAASAQLFGIELVRPIPSW